METYVAAIIDAACVGVVIVDAEDQESAERQVMQTEDLPQGGMLCVRVPPAFDARGREVLAQLAALPRHSVLPPDVVVNWCLFGENQWTQQ